ncbi:hypothetical protein MLD38_023227 [Melastoma candidum]|uniref:Uncharacterized protein n=1 Tax=Melastoma candidum TaxID=119954 RepID=A0ACB9QN12_9MYRT|nr:hypothetical protein MLD38_023227 [Melastoma candidum]
MTTPQRFAFALFIAVLMSCTPMSSAARPVPSETETTHLESLAVPLSSASPTAQPSPATRWLPIWVKVVPNLPLIRATAPATASSSSSEAHMASSSAKPMFMGFPGTGSGSGFGLPLVGSGSGSFFGFPGAGIAEPIVPPV